MGACTPLSEKIAPMNLIYRAATASDRDAVARLWLEANRARSGHEVPVDPELIASRIETEGAFGFVAHDADMLIGSLILSPALMDRGTGPAIPGLAHLNTVAVAPGHWGRGIARTLVDLVLDEARARGYARIQLFTQDHNARARDLYERNGWELTGEEIVDEHGDTLVRYLRIV
jgi:ribosomal protein S18 acetylase RimI-like enzyme